MYNKEENSIILINEMYKILFNGFNDYWNFIQVNDFMQFNLFFQKYIKENSLNELKLKLV